MNLILIEKSHLFFPFKSWMTVNEKFFTPSYLSLTDYGACHVVYPYLDYEYADKNKIPPGAYNGSTFYYEVGLNP